MNDAKLNAAAAAYLRRAADIVRAGWCSKAVARAANGEPVTVLALAPANPSAKEAALAPTQFDVGGAIFRAAASPVAPRGGKEDPKLRYLGIANEPAYQRALWIFCGVAKTMHPSIWNDEVCRSAEQAATMLETAAAAA